MTHVFTITTASSEQTFELGKITGEQLNTGIVITLVGDLGSGKTAFVQGLAQGVEVPPGYYITSPTYTLINDYPGRLPFYHVDLYRLNTIADIEEIGLNDILSGNFIIAIEWADRIRRQDLGDHLAVRIQITGRDKRQFNFTAYGRSNKLLLKEIEKICRGVFMGLIVQKYGGTSVADPDRIRNVAKRVSKTYNDGHNVVVILSAMAGVTDKLIDLAGQAAQSPDKRELDVLLATGEQTTAALLAMTLRDMNYPARSMLGHQAQVVTDRDFGNARILEIGTNAIKNLLAQRNIVVVTGFQGTDSQGNITTLGRGGSDTSAVAIAAALKADICEIYTDVDGVYTADPNICGKARKIKIISYDEMLNMASLGAKVLQIRSVGFAKKYKIPVHVRSSFNEEEGTMVVSENSGMESVMVSAVTHDKNQAWITLNKVPDQPGIAAKIFTPLADKAIVVDMIIQNTHAGGQTDLTFTVPENEYEMALEIEKRVAQEIGAEDIIGKKEIAKVSVIGVGMKNHSGVAATMFTALAAENINISMISTSEIRISCVVDEKYTELAVRVLHTAFGLDAE